MNRQLNFLVFLFAVIFSVPFPSSALAEQFYLAPDGVDVSSHSGSSANPWKTIQYAIGRMSQSDDLILKGGTYNISATQTVTKGGKSWNRMNIEAANNENVTINAAGMTQIWASAISIRAPWVTFKGIHVANNEYGSGITGHDDNIIIDGCNSYTHGTAGIRITALNDVTQWDDVPKNCVIKNCGAWNTCLWNMPGHFLYEPEWRQNGGGWPTAIGILRAQDGKIQNCWSGFNYGEGINLSRVRGGRSEISDCEATDNFSVNIYVDSVSGETDNYVTIRRNLAETRFDDRYYRYPGVPAINFLVATEDYDDGLGWNDSRYIGIIDNFAYDGGHNFVIGSFGPTMPDDLWIDGNTAGAFTWSSYKNDTGSSHIWLGTNIGF